MLFYNKNIEDVYAEDLTKTAGFDQYKLDRIISSFPKLLENTGKGN